MQAIVMAAGKGSRLGEFTDGAPKSFLRINDETLIDRNLAALQAAGVSDIVLVTGYRAEMFEEKYGGNPSIHLANNPFYDSTNVLTSFWFGQPQLNGDFLFLHADTIFDPMILQRLLATDGDVVLPVEFGPCDEEAMKVRISEGSIVEINKTMPVASASGEFIGLAKVSANVLPQLQRITESLVRGQRFDAFFEVALQQLIDDGKFRVTAMPTDGLFWSEIDFVEDYEYAKANVGRSAPGPR